MKMMGMEGWFATLEPAGLGPEARAGRGSVGDVSERVEAWVRERGVVGRSAVCLRALALLWHDHLEAAHRLVQDLSGGDAAWVHGIMHRREPDDSNARYWFHRVGQHPAFEPLAEAAAPCLEAQAALPYRLIRDGRWDPMAFVDAVSAVRRPGASAEVVRLLRELQGLEFRVLAAHLAGR